MKELFSKYRSRIAKEGIVKACLAGGSIGLFFLFASSAVLYFVPLNQAWLTGASFWLPIAAFVLTAAVATVIFYFAKYRPTTQTVARRLDDLGLHERIVTMTELEGDDSYIATRQREDAMKSLESVTSGMLKMAIPAKLIVCAAIVACLGVGAYTVNALAEIGVVNSGVQILENMGKEDTDFFEVSYDIMGDGEIFGDMIQVVEDGEESAVVYANAAEGWAFVGWVDEDGNAIVDGDSPERMEENVKDNIYLIAVFQEVEYTDDPNAPPDPNGKGDPSGGSDRSESDDPSHPSNSDESGNSNGNADEGEGNGNSTAAGRNENTNQVIDGNTYYGDPLDQYRDNANQQMNDTDGLDDWHKGAVNDYYESINENVGSDEGDGNGEGSDDNP